MIINLKQLEKRKDFLRNQNHPKLDLTIWNYNEKCNYENKWDEYTKMCRGLILNKKGEIIARPFPKFFNVGQNEESELKNLPGELPEITEKLDGSLGIQYYDGEKVCIASRGSFESEQSKWATDWISKEYKKSDFKEGYTYLYEIIYPENRIVINYGKRAELVLLAVINIKDGSELDLKDEAEMLGLAYPRFYDYKNTKEIIPILSKLSGNEEGFVVRYPSNNFRVKMKGEEYVRLHKIITGLNTKHIWEYLKEGKELGEFLEAVPDEFYNWVKGNIKEMKDKFKKIMNDAMGYADFSNKFETKKEKAEYIFRNHKEISSVIFALIDEKEKKAKERAWRLVKPISAEPFRQDIDSMEETA